MDVAAALKSTDAQAESLSRLTSISAASIKDRLAIMVAVLIELGSGLGLWVTTAGAGAGQAKTMPEPAALSPALKGLRPLQIEGRALDPVASFVKARCRKLATGEEKVAELHAAYRTWAAIEGHEELSSKALGSRLADLGFERSKRGGVVRWGGLALRSA